MCEPSSSTQAVSRHVLGARVSAPSCWRLHGEQLLMRKTSNEELAAFGEQLAAQGDRGDQAANP